MSTTMIMKNSLRATSRARLLAIAIGLVCTPPLLAQSLPLKGRWLPDDHPEAPAPYALLTIKDGILTWRGLTTSAPKCDQPFELKKENPGTVYTNGHGTKFVAGALGSLPTYLLKPSPSSCGSSAEDIRINFPLVYDTNHIELVEYVHGKPVSVRRLHRKK